MSVPDDGHSAETCTYFKCDGNPTTPCPFLKDEPKPKAIVECEHEWRQYWTQGTSYLDVSPDGFFCIHCQTLTNS